MAQLSTEQACLTLPPVQVKYDPKGRTVDAFGLKTYEIKNGSSKKAIVFVYDIFGNSAQLYQGADLLSSAGYDVFIPDIFKGGHLDHDTFPNLSPEDKKATRAKFDAGPAVVETQVKALAGILKDVRAQGYERVAIVGFCWGAMCTQVPGFDAYAMLHPGGGMTPDKVDAPTCLLPSMNEDEQKMDAFHQAMLAKPCGSKCVMKWFKNMQHGWAAARGNLADPEGRKGFQDAYETVATFLNDVL